MSLFDEIIWKFVYFGVIVIERCKLGQYTSRVVPGRDKGDDRLAKKIGGEPCEDTTYEAPQDIQWCVPFQTGLGIPFALRPDLTPYLCSVPSDRVGYESREIVARPTL